jgi:transposase-like protein
MAKAGRPTVLTQEVHDAIVRALHVGAYIETAAAAAGIHKSTLYDWLKRGAREKRRAEKGNGKGNGHRIRKAEAAYVAFSDAVKKAMAESELVDIATIAKASKRTWQAAAWRLERKYPDRWGRKDRIDASITGKDGGPVVTEVVFVKPDGKG